ncbi:diacylglycerol/lipid kinase family protein [Dongia rigui]|uniref:Diacylglycerol kinase family protein n=1 Tax=Dongia rigui TaxID=940149 RepID=A0ABU5DX79_9PROT|nr:diacylglycerol kinase family protein [Dongia rigui]MDY0871520.1 diacylglycerol kinase family protein [Dongia rigui]
MQTLLVHNKSAGAGHLTPAELTTALEAGGLTVRHCAPQDAQLDRCLAEPSQMVVLAGGDGTVARILAKLPFQKRVVAIVPLGTANNIAQSLGILDPAQPGSGNEIVTAWRHADRRGLDIGRVSGPWGQTRFVEAVGIGPLAKTILQFKTEGVTAADSIRLGREAFRHALAHAEPLRSTIALDGVPVPAPLLLAEAMNIQHAGSRLHLAPAAETDDGYFDVVTVAPEQRDDMLAWIDGGCSGVAPLSVTRARSVEIDWRGDPLRIDDYGPEMRVHEGRVSVNFLAERLEVLVPSERDRTNAAAAAPGRGPDIEVAS